MPSLEALRSSLTAEAPPPGSDLALQALWRVGRGDWDGAHACAQSGEGEAGCDWVHAHLHRAEGDAANAGYWYRRAGRLAATTPLETEWEQIARSLLSRTAP